MRGLRTARDAKLLEWAAADGRIVITSYRSTWIGLAYARAAGLPLPGLFVLRPAVTMGQAIETIVLLALCSDHEEWKDKVTFLPL